VPESHEESTPEQILRTTAAEVIERSIEGSDNGKYEVAAQTDLDVDLVDRVLASYANWLRDA
jgi:hypothetical protein